MNQNQQNPYLTQMLGRIQPQTVLNPQAQEQMQKEIQTNPLIRLMLQDSTMSERLRQTKDPKLAEQLMQDKLLSIGLTKPEAAIVMLSAMKTPIEKVIEKSQWSKEEIDRVYDEGIDKVNRVLGTSTSVLDNLGSVFGKGKIYP